MLVNNKKSKQIEHPCGSGKAINFIDLLFQDQFVTKERQCNSDAKQFHNFFQQSASKLQKSKQTLVVLSDKQMLYQNNKSFKFYSFLYYCQFGAMISLQKQKQFQETKVRVHFPVAWDFGVSVTGRTYTYSPQNPMEFKCIQIGQLKLTSSQKQFQLQFFDSSLKKNISQAQSKKDKDNRKNHHTPTWLVQRVIQSINQFNGQDFQRNQIRQRAQSMEHQNSHGGTLDVGQHTGTTKPNTVLEVVEAFYRFFYQNKLLFKKTLICIKLNTLKNAITKPANGFQIQLSKLQECFKKLIYQIKQYDNNGIAYDQEYTLSKLKQIKQLLDSKKPLITQPQTITPKQIQQSIQKYSIKQFQIKQIQEYTNIALFQQLDQSVKDDVGFSRSIKLPKDFSSLITLHNQLKHQKQYIWILMVEDFFFQQIARINKNQVNIQIKQVTCTSHTKSKIQQVMESYQKVIKSVDKIRDYGMKLKNQSQSHVYLIKFIASVIAFEVVRKYRKNQTQSNLQGYRVPVQEKIAQLHKNFYSLSFGARQAMKQLVLYTNKYSSKSDIFLLEQKITSYYSFAVYVANETEQIKNWIKDKQSSLQKEKKTLKQKIFKTKSQHQQLQGELSTCRANQTVKCKCIHSHWNRITCSSCNRIQNLQNQISTLQREKESFIIANYAKEQTKFYGFVFNIPGDILGMMKMIYYSQIDTSSRQFKFDNARNFFNQNYSCDYDQLRPYTKFVQQDKFNTVQNAQTNIQKLVKYPQGLIHFHEREYHRNHPINCDKLAAQRINGNQQVPLQFALNHPRENKSARQHESYAKMYLKDKKVSYQDWLNYSNVRVTDMSQLNILCELILSRKISLRTLNKFVTKEGLIEKNRSNRILFSSKKGQTQLIESQDQKYLEMLIILNAVADLNSYSRLDCYKPRQFQMVKESMEQLLQDFLKEWRYQDLYFMQILGVLFSLFGATLNKQQQALSLAQRAFEQYEHFCKQKNEGQNQIKSKKTYFLQGILCCFMQDLVSNVQQVVSRKRASVLFAKLLLLYRANKVFSDQNKQSHLERETILYFQNYKERCIYNNVEAVRNFFRLNLHELTAIVRQVDSGIDETVYWAYDQARGDYVFTGVSPDGKTQYNLNLFSGKLLKNGKELAGISDNIKKNPLYVAIFGQNRSLEVLPQNGSLRTTSSFSDLMTTQKDTIVLFQFKLLSKQNLVISMILKRAKSTLIYVLIPPAELEKINFGIPLLYSSCFFAWYCQENDSIVFRRKLLQKMDLLGLVLLTEKSKYSQLKVIEGRIVTKQFQHHEIDYLISDQNSEIFQHIQFFEKQETKITQRHKAFQILSQIQKPQFIIQLSSPQGKQKKERKIKFWLYRYSMKFYFDYKNGLIFENYNSYRISTQYKHHDLLPWQQKDKAKVLVLRKIQDNIRTCCLNQIIILIPNLYVSARGIMDQGLDPESKLQIFTYEIHDHFKDLRSKTVVSQLHISCVVSSIKSAKIVSQVNMTSNEYVCHLLRSCYSIRSLSCEQIGKLQNMIKIGLQQSLGSITLICEVIKTTSQSLRHVLPFHGKEAQAHKIDKNKSSNDMINLINHYKMKYMKDFQEGKVTTREKLSRFQLKVLGMHRNKALMDTSQGKAWDLRHNLKDIAEDDQLLKSVERIIASNQNQNKQIAQYAARNQKSEEEIQSQADVFFESLGFDVDQSCQMTRQQIKDLKQSLFSYERSYDKLHKFKFQNLQKPCFLGFLKIIKKRIHQKRRHLAKMFFDIQDKDKDHYDVLDGKIKYLSQRDFTLLLTDCHFLKAFYPNITQAQERTFKKIAKLWIQLTVLIDSNKRVEKLLNQEVLDKISLFRQLQSPRQKINQKDAWLCYEAQMRIQIWNSQYHTYNELTNSKNGAITQLNMGEGKTQVIIPMLVLDILYSKSKKDKKIPRVHLLSTLYEQAKNNYFKFFSASGFRLKTFPIKFNRQVQLGDLNIKHIHKAISMFEDKTVILVDRQSYLSMILKVRQKARQIKKNNSESAKKGYLLQEAFFNGIQCIDIFDEVDAYMTPKKSFVYSVGGQSILPGSQLRYQMCRILLKIVVNKKMLGSLQAKQIAIIEQSQQSTVERLQHGGFPKGFRFISHQNQANKQQKMKKFRRQIVQQILCQSQFTSSYIFCRDYSEQKRSRLIQFLIGPEKKYESIWNIQLVQKNKDVIFILRGLIAYGVLQHCLTLRAGVDYGCPESQNKKRVAVPYEAADLPSKRSQFAHPEVAILLSYLSYFDKGLSQEQFQIALEKLYKLPQGSKQYNYSSWLQSLAQKNRPQQVMTSKQLNIQSKKQKKILYQTYKYNRNTVVFWLVHCVFPDDLLQYVNSITASCWDLGLSKQSMGFSGTKDNRWTMNNYLTYQKTKIDEIKGTDGKMLMLTIKNALAIHEIPRQQKEQKDDKDLWIRFVEKSLELDIGCIIDAGAILVGKSLYDQIVPFIGKDQLYKKKNYRGILFPNQKGQWIVFDTSACLYINRNTSIPDHQCFVIFDQARTRGADIKMDQNMKAVVSLAPNMNKDKLMQAIGRLRKLGRNQQIYFLGSAQITSKIQGLSELKQGKMSQRIAKIIEWTCKNTINQNKKMLFPNLRLAQTHLRNLQQYPSPYLQQSQLSLQVMYRKDVILQQLNQIVDEEPVSFKRKQSVEQFREIIKSVKKYGRNFQIKKQAYDQVCQRQSQKVQQKQQESQYEYSRLHAIAQKDEICQYDKQKISSMDIRLNKNLKFSQNFLNCTQSLQNNLVPTSKNGLTQGNQLCEIKYVRISNRKMLVITQRQFRNILLDQQQNCFGPKSINRNVQKEQMRDTITVRFSDLTLDNIYVQEFGLKQILIDAQYFNGCQRFLDTDILVKTIRYNMRRLEKVGIRAIVTHFIERRRTLDDKFKKSDLEKAQNLINSILEI